FCILSISSSACTTASTSLSLHDALPILLLLFGVGFGFVVGAPPSVRTGRARCEPGGVGFWFWAKVSRSCADFLSCSPVFGVPCLDRKSTRLNSSHVKISYAAFCLKQTNG